MPIELSLRALTQADLPAVARVHCAAFPASALTALGREAVRRYYEWQLTGPHEVTARGIFQNDELAGFYFGGVFRGALSGFLAKERVYLAWRILMHPWLALNPLFRNRFKTGWRVLKKKLFGKPKPASPSVTIALRQFGILAIAVDPAYQGCGAGQRLMASAEETARAQRFPEMQLNVATDNAQALRFYERGGWQHVEKNGVWQGDMIKPLNE